MINFFFIKILQNSAVYKFIARADDNQKHITCRISNDEFLIEDTTILKVNYAPKFVDNILHMARRKIFFGDSLTLACATDQSPPILRIQWAFTQNNRTRELSANDSTIFIQAANEEHEGIYECIVKNRIGKAQRKFNVEVMPRGKFDQIIEGRYTSTKKA